MNYRVILGEMSPAEYASLVNEVSEETLDALLTLAHSNEVVKYLDDELHHALCDCITVFDKYMKRNAK